MSGWQRKVFSYLYGYGACSVWHLARVLGASISWLKHVLGRLTEKNLIRSQVMQGARVCWVAPWVLE